MPHTTFSAAPSAATDALFRAWGKGLSDSLATVGMVRVPTPGEVDWATVLRSTAVRTVAGWQIWAFDDGLPPLFVKIGFGSSSSNASRPSLSISVGKGVDGTGGLTGILLPEVRLGDDSSSNSYGISATPNTHLVATCAGRSCLTVIMNAGPEAVCYSSSFIIERSRNNAGEATGDGLSVAYTIEPGAATGGVVAPGPSNTFVAIAYESGQSNVGVVPVVVPYTVAGVVVGAGSSLASGVIAPVLPWIAFAPGLAPWQPLAAVSYVPGDAVANSVISVRILGKDLPYRVVRYGVGANGWGVSIRPFDSFTGGSFTGGRAVALMILWED